MKQFSEIIEKGEGYIIITDDKTGNHIHRPNCSSVTEENFRKKVLDSKCKEGHYYWIDNIVFCDLHGGCCK